MKKNFSLLTTMTFWGFIVALATLLVCFELLARAGTQDMVAAQSSGYRLQTMKPKNRVL